DLTHDNVLYARGRPRPSACFCAEPPPLGGRQALNKAINGSPCWSTASTGPTGVAPSASDCSRPKCGSSKAMPLPAGAGELGVLTVMPANPYSAQRQYKPPRAVLTRRCWAGD